MNNGTQLLVSVRSPAEALAALEGGAALIDVKEPARGSLGRAGCVRPSRSRRRGCRTSPPQVRHWANGRTIPGLFRSSI